MKIKICLFLIFSAAALLRILWLDKYPSGFTPDEASFGYDAYSILKTGADQWGRSFPLSFKSFGDYKMPLYGYLSVPFVFIFGLSEFSVRLPAALLGTLSVVFTYLLVKAWRKNENEALISSFFLAVSPWHIALSRGAFEANLTSFFITSGVYFFLKGGRRFVFLSSLILGLNLFSYHSARFVTPFLFLVLLFKLRKNRKERFIFVVPFLFFVLLAVFSYLGGAGSRVATAGIFSSSSNMSTERFVALTSGMPEPVARVFNNKYIYFGKVFADNYLSYYSTEFLFSRGAGEFTYGMMPGVGVFYYLDFIFLFLFIAYFFSRFDFKKDGWFAAWLFISPIPAALSIGPGYAANRAVVVLPALVIASGLGASYFLNKFLKIKIFHFFVFIAYLLFFVFFVEKYFVQMPVRGSSHMIYGAKQVFDFLSEHESFYEKIIVSKSVSEPHIFAAFYLKMNPVEYQKQSQKWRFEEEGLMWVDQLNSYSLGKYVFKSLEEGDFLYENALIVGTGEEIPKNANLLETVFYPDGNVAYKIIDTSEKLFAYGKH